MALDFIAGCLGGCAGVLIGHPFDTIKVHLQTRASLYKNCIDCCNKLILQEGAGALYKGVASPLIGVSGMNAIIFSIYSSTRRQLATDSLKTHFIAGCIAGLAQTALASPIELIKLKTQTALSKTSLRQCVRDIYKRDNLRGFYKGLNLTVMRDVPAFGLYFTTYELLLHDGREASTLKFLMAGGVAGVVSWLITYPLDVIKTRLQIAERGVYANAFDCFVKTWHADGPRVLYRGLAPTLIRAFPVNAAVFGVVKMSLHWFEDWKLSFSMNLAVI